MAIPLVYGWVGSDNLDIHTNLNYVPSSFDLPQRDPFLSFYLASDTKP